MNKEKNIKQTFSLEQRNKKLQERCSKQLHAKRSKLLKQIRNMKEEEEIFDVKSFLKEQFENIINDEAEGAEISEEEYYEIMKSLEADFEEELQRQELELLEEYEKSQKLEDEMLEHYFKENEQLNGNL